MKNRLCAICEEKIGEDLLQTFYCFSCDSVFCASCSKSKIDRQAGNWICPNCNSKKKIDDATLIRK